MIVNQIINKLIKSLKKSAIAGFFAFYLLIKSVIYTQLFRLASLLLTKNNNRSRTFTLSEECF